jgi:uncharacterized protein (DUF169 family)
MGSLQEGFKVLERFDFERRPVCVKYLFFRPEGIERLPKSMPICEMLIEAQQGKPFYADRENLACAGKVITGMEEVNPLAASGQIGLLSGVFDDARAGARLVAQIPKLPKNTANYVAFSSPDLLSFDPDVLILTCTVRQAEIALRALSYRTGNAWSGRASIVVSCAWFYIYPVVTGEPHYMVTGLGHGMRWRKVLPEGLIIISIPFDLLPGFFQNLREMNRVLKSHLMDKEEYERWVSAEKAKMMHKQDDDYKPGVELK